VTTRIRQLFTWSLKKVAQLFTINLLALFAFAAAAHESRPAYLEISASGQSVLTINWTRPVLEGRVLQIHPVFPDTCKGQGGYNSYQMAGLLHERWLLECADEDLINQKIAITGFANTITDVLLRFQARDGRTHVKLLDITDPVFLIPAETAAVENVAPYYFRTGIQHILEGNDHLLFVLALLLLLNGFWLVIKTITAFTLAHSISLAAAVLGYVHVPSTPVEAVIALSIMFVACELLRDDNRSLSRRLPWLIAAVFGLVHGLGFAGALAEIGLPEDEIPLALFMFNIGVEAGQVMFIILASVILLLLRRVMQTSYQQLEKISSYGIGSIGAFWLIERISNFY
jgi:hydrogenase/urease accessory protein HupE